MDVLAAAQAGDESAFTQLVAGHRRELQVHCYRMLWSLEDGEDAAQAAMVAAWRGLSGFEQRSSLRAWVGRRIRLGGATMQVVGPVPRCVVTNENPDSGVVDFST